MFSYFLFFHVEKECKEEKNVCCLSTIHRCWRVIVEEEKKFMYNIRR
jgi:hypothetical protein